MSESIKRESWEQEIKQRYHSLLHKLPYFETGKGWDKVLENMFEEIFRREKFISANELNQDYEPLYFVQIKQKYGCLRAYHFGGNDDGITAIIQKAEVQADATCEHCGCVENVAKHSIRGWFSTLCKSCVDIVTEQKQYKPK